MEISLIIISLALLVIVVRGAAAGRFFRGRRAPLAMLTIFHDWSPRDKQAAVEQIIQENAGTKQQEPETGEGKKERSTGQ